MVGVARHRRARRPAWRRAGEAYRCAGEDAGVKRAQAKAEQLSLEPRVIKGDDYKKFLKDNEASTKKLMGW